MQLAEHLPDFVERNKQIATDVKSGFSESDRNVIVELATNKAIVDHTTSFAIEPVHCELICSDSECFAANMTRRISTCADKRGKITFLSDGINIVRDRDTMPDAIRLHKKVLEVDQRECKSSFADYAENIILERPARKKLIKFRYAQRGVDVVDYGHRLLMLPLIPGAR